MFEPRENSGYDKLTDGAAQLIAKWTMNDWYESSTEADIGADEDAGKADMATD